MTEVRLVGCPSCSVIVGFYGLPDPDSEGFVKCPVCKQPHTLREWLLYAFKVEEWPRP
jgi:hypothetical protein